MYICAQLVYVWNMSRTERDRAELGPRAAGAITAENSAFTETARNAVTWRAEEAQQEARSAPTASGEEE
jgi:hypothetical protein